MLGGARFLDVSGDSAVATARLLLGGAMDRTWNDAVVS